MIKTIYTLGYSGWKIEEIEATLTRLDAVLVDVRMIPRSRWAPQWNGTALHNRLGDRYVWLKEFGNRNYKGTFDQIEIADFPAGEQRLRELAGMPSPDPAPTSSAAVPGSAPLDASLDSAALAPLSAGKAEGIAASPVEGKAIILFCGCADVNQCHRKVLADWLARTWGAEVVHLTRPENQISSSQPTLF